MSNHNLYECTLCKTSHKSNALYRKHLKTKKHIRNESTNQISLPENPTSIKNESAHKLGTDVIIESKEVKSDNEIPTKEVKSDNEIPTKEVKSDNEIPTKEVKSDNEVPTKEDDMAQLPDIMNITLSSSNSDVHYLYHLSDIHIHCEKRHDEYREIFAQFICEIDKNNYDGSVPFSEAAFVITGDYLDNKNRITPEEIVLAREFILELAHRCPTFIIAGNHDKNLHFSQKEDNITAVVSNGNFENKNVYYLKHTGVYHYSNISFGVSSVFDYRNVTIDDVISNERREYKNGYNIALFHGGVGKYMLYNGMYGTEKTKSLADFEGYDYVLLGDIHKWQFLDNDHRIAYAGSMIQKNHGENWNDHGYLLWNLRTKDIQHHNIYNNYRFVTLVILDGNLITPLDNLPQHLYVRWDIRETDAIGAEPINKIQERVRALFSVDDEQYKHSSFSPETEYKEGPRTSFDLSIDKQIEYTKAWLRVESKIVNDEDQTRLMEMLREYNSQIKEEISPVINWRLVDLQFENIFCYEDSQHIIFRGMKGVNGIVAHNNAGKSAIFDILLFTLFGRCTRSDSYSFGDLVHIPNNKNNEILPERALRCSVQLHTVEGDDIWKISRSCTRDRGSMLVTIEKNNVRQYHGSGRDGNAIITKMIGNYEDFMTTIILAQNSVHNFLLMTGKQQKEFTGRIFRLDLYDKIHILAKKDLRKISIDKKIAEKTYDELLSEKIEERKKEMETNYVDILAKRKELADERKKSQESLTLLRSKLKSILPNEPFQTLSDLQNSKKSLLEDIKSIQEKRGAIILKYDINEEDLEEVFTQTREQLKQCEIQDDSCYRNDLLQILNKGEKLRAQLKNLRGKKSKEETILFSLENCLRKQIEFEKAIEITRKYIDKKQEYLDSTKDITQEIVDKKRQELMSKLSLIPQEPTEDPFLSIRSSNNENEDLAVEAEYRMNQAVTLYESLRSTLKTIETFTFEHSDPLPEEQEVFCKSLYTQFKNTKKPIQREPLWDNKRYEEENKRYIRLQHQRESSLIELKNINENKEKLENHRYDPRCVFCCENPFVRKAEQVIAKENEVLTSIDKVEQSIKILELTLNAQKVLRERDLVAKELKMRILNKTKQINDLKLCIDKHKKQEKIRLEIREKKEEMKELKEDSSRLEESWKCKQDTLLTLEKASHMFDSLIGVQSDLSSLIETYRWVKEENEKILERVPTIRKKYEDLSEIVAASTKEKETENKIVEIEEKIRTKFYNNEVRERNKDIQEKISKLESEIHQYIESDNKIQRTEIELSVKIEQLEKQLEKLENTEKELKQLTQENDLLSLIVSLSHHNGIPAFLLRKITKQMEETTNKILSQYSKMRVKIKNEGKETVISVRSADKAIGLNAKMLCGSEKFLVELAFRVSFQILSNVSKPNFMVCDEGWSCLDEDARARLRHLLSALLEHNEYILTVSHINDVKAWMTKAISIEIGENGSHRVKQ